MPLYTYISSYRGGVHAEQGRYSNFKGFASGVSSQIPEAALPGLTPALRKELAEKAYRCEWVAVPGRSGLWKSAFALGGSDFVVHVVETAG
ncbi:MAG TPA: hypothetical protein VGB79_15315 [Allosphingosinicella sp.]|jgi:hypothetical protein